VQHENNSSFTYGRYPQQRLLDWKASSLQAFWFSGVMVWNACKGQRGVIAMHAVLSLAMYLPFTFKDLGLNAVLLDMQSYVHLNILNQLCNGIR